MVQLSYRRNWGPATADYRPDRWVLSALDKSETDGPVTVDLVVDRSWNGESWNSYRAFVTDEAGHVRELVTFEKMSAQYSAYHENEGEEPSEEWFAQWSMESSLQRTADDLKKHWEAMVDDLKLFQPAVTL